VSKLTREQESVIESIKKDPKRYAHTDFARLAEHIGISVRLLDEAQYLGEQAEEKAERTKRKAEREKKKAEAKAERAENNGELTPEQKALADDVTANPERYFLSPTPARVGLTLEQLKTAVPPAEPVTEGAIAIPLPVIAKAAGLTLGPPSDPDADAKLTLAEGEWWAAATAGLPKILGETPALPFARHRDICRAPCPHPEAIMILGPYDADEAGIIAKLAARIPLSSRMEGWTESDTRIVQAIAHNRTVGIRELMRRFNRGHIQIKGIAGAAGWIFSDGVWVKNTSKNT
jgi:hypothetical protein